MPRSLTILPTMSWLLRRSLSKDFRATGQSGGNVAGATLVGQMVAEKALQHGVQQVVFDRNGFLYHGRVRAVALGAREKGLQF